MKLIELLTETGTTEKRSIGKENTLTRSLKKTTKQSTIMIRLKPVLDKFNPDYKDVSLIISSALKNKIDPTLAIAVVIIESSFRKNAIHHNRDGSEDYGYFQLNGRWHKQHKNNLAQHIETGVKYLEWCLKSSERNEAKALSLYNTGSKDAPIGRRYANKVLSVKKQLDKALKN